VLIADDSRVARQLLTHLLNSDPRFCVVGAVEDGQAAVEFLREKRLDVIVMDIHMPRLDGFEATRQIMETNPLPIVICTATADPKEMAVAFRSMEAGAVACVEKPLGLDHPLFASCVENLQQTIRLMSEVRVVRRWNRARPAPVPPRMV